MFVSTVHINYAGFMAQYAIFIIELEMGNLNETFWMSSKYFSRIPFPNSSAWLSTSAINHLKSPHLCYILFIHVAQNSSEMYFEITISRKFFKKLENLEIIKVKTLTTMYKKMQMATQNIK